MQFNVESFDRFGIAQRLRALILPRNNENLADAAAALGVEELSLRISLDEISPHPTAEVVIAVVRTMGVDANWLVTGNYDLGQHRAVEETGTSADDAVRALHGQRPTPIAEPPSTTGFRINEQR